MCERERNQLQGTRERAAGSIGSKMAIYANRAIPMSTVLIFSHIAIPTKVTVLEIQLSKIVCTTNSWGPDPSSYHITSIGAREQLDPHPTPMHRLLLYRSAHLLCWQPEDQIRVAQFICHCMWWMDIPNKSEGVGSITKHIAMQKQPTFPELTAQTWWIKCSNPRKFMERTT